MGTGFGGGNGFALTDEQREAVESDGRILVAASAGAGKTSTMIKKIIREIAAGIPLSRILVLVYNEAAADEIKEKLHSALFDAACAADGAQRDLFRRSLDDLAFADIGTIHAFCRALLKENFEKAGISPSFDVIDEREEAVYAKEAMDVVFAAYSAEEDETFGRLADILSRGRKEDGLRAAVARLHKIYEIQPDRTAFERKVKECFAQDGGIYADTLVRRAKSLYSKCAALCRDIMPALIVTGQTAYADRVTALTRICDEGAAAGFEGLMALAERGVELPSARKTKGADEYAVECAKAVYDAVCAETEMWRVNLSSPAKVREGQAQNAVFADKLMETVKRFDEEFTARKRADDVLSFADLERCAAELAASGEDFGADYDIVFVDEYQDVNPVQEYIISSLVRDNAFMVGDVKQSIYGFRLADPSVFLRRKADYECGGGKHIGFYRNFRSERHILEFVNAVFDTVMTAESADIDYARDGRFSVEDGGDGVGDNVQIHLFCSESGRQSSLECEGRFIAGEIKRLCGRATGDGGRLTYGDFAVLFRSRNSAAQRITACLREAGIPVDDGGFSREIGRPERDLINFLTVLDNPRQDLPLCGFMLSYFGGFDESELALVAAGRAKDECLYDAALRRARNGDALGAKLTDMFKVLDGYRLKASFKSVPELMQSIVADYSFDAYMAAEGEGAASGVISFVSASAGRDVSEGLSKFLAAYNGREQSADKRPSGGDRVKISTFHGYKGLEAPVVFVAGVAEPRGRGRSAADVLVDNGGCIGMKYYDTDRRTVRPTLSYAAVSAMTEERENKEEMRLFYVALTRAKQYLYVTGSPYKNALAAYGRLPRLGGAACNLDYLSAAAYAGRLHCGTFVHTGNAGDSVSEKRAVLPVAAECRADDSESIGEGVRFEYPYAASAALSMKYSVSALDGGGDELTLSAFADRADEGTLYHTVMEHINFSAKGTAGVADELGRMVRENIISKEEAGQVDAAAVARCLDSPLIELARRSVCYREKPFMMYLPAERAGGAACGDKVLVQGVIDLIIDGPEKIIVDFKNSYLSNAEALEKYKRQLKLYKTAVESSFLPKVDRTVLYSFKTGAITDTEV